MEGLDNCHRETNATCTDIIGSFMCNCSQGFTGKGTYCTGACKGMNISVLFAITFSCSDFDECLEPSNNNCNSSAFCNNTFGSYTCTCNLGYIGNGIFCDGK